MRNTFSQQNNMTGASWQQQQRTGVGPCRYEFMIQVLLWGLSFSRYSKQRTHGANLSNLCVPGRSSAIFCSRRRCLTLIFMGRDITFCSLTYRRSKASLLAATRICSAQIADNWTSQFETVNTGSPSTIAIVSYPERCTTVAWCWASIFFL